MRHLSLVLPALFAFSAAVHAQSAQLTAQQQLARDIYQELISINTADSVGSVTRAAEALATRFRDAGFDARDVQVLVPQGHPTKGNLVVRLRAKPGTSARPLLLLAHLDVVAANRSEWPRDPFTLVEENGFFHGRGTSDDKAMASMFVANLIRMKKEGVAPRRDIILALTADEEGGIANGVEYLIANHRQLIDAEYAINEGGGGTLENGKPALHSIQAAEKVPANFTLTATNTGGHSSVPRPDNAINQLAAALVRIANFSFPVALNEVTRDYFTQVAATEPNAEYAAAMRTLVANSGDSNAAAVLSREPRYNAQLRTTCVTTRISGGHANNALPQTATATVNCRILPTSNAEETIATLRQVIADSGLVLSRITGTTERFGAAPSAMNPELLAATKEITRQMWGDIPVIQTMSTGATDGRFLRAVGIPTYGISGIFSVPGETNAHGRDEKLRVKSFYEGLEFLDRLVRRLATQQRNAA